MIGSGRALALPALRTARAVFPHTALQSAVSTSGASRDTKLTIGRSVGLAREGITGRPGTPLPVPIPCAWTGGKLPPTPGRAGASASAPRSALSGTAGALIASLRLHASTFLPPFPKDGFASRPFATAAAASRYYEGSDSCRPRPRSAGLSAYSASPCGHPAPNHAMPSSAFAATSARPADPLPGPGFAIGSQARHGISPNRVRSPTGCPFASGCSPPRLAATQLPSASCAVTSHGKDSHLTDEASSRTHDPRAKHEGDGNGIKGRPSEPGCHARCVNLVAP